MMLPGMHLLFFSRVSAASHHRDAVLQLAFDTEGDGFRNNELVLAGLDNAGQFQRADIEAEGTVRAEDGAVAAAANDDLAGLDDLIEHILVADALRLNELAAKLLGEVTDDAEDAGPFRVAGGDVVVEDDQHLLGGSGGSCLCGCNIGHAVVDDDVVGLDRDHTAGGSGQQSLKIVSHRFAPS